MTKDTPVLFMTIIFLMMIVGIMVFGIVENAKHPSQQQAALDPTTMFILTE